MTILCGYLFLKTTKKNTIFVIGYKLFKTISFNPQRLKYFFLFGEPILNEFSQNLWFLLFLLLLNIEVKSKIYDA